MEVTRPVPLNSTGPRRDGCKPCRIPVYANALWILLFLFKSDSVSVASQMWHKRCVSDLHAVSHTFICQGQARGDGTGGRAGRPSHHSCGAGRSFVNGSSGKLGAQDSLLGPGDGSVVTQQMFKTQTWAPDRRQDRVSVCVCVCVWW